MKKREQNFIENMKKWNTNLKKKKNKKKNRRIKM